MCIESVFDGNYESIIFFYENMYMKKENRKIRAHFGIALKTFQYFHSQ